MLKKRFPGTIGLLSAQEADQMERDIQEAFGKIDRHFLEIAELEVKTW